MASSRDKELPCFEFINSEQLLNQSLFLQNGETKYVRIIYLIPSDSIEKPEYTIALGNAARHLQAWYYRALGQDKTFHLHDPVVEVYQTSHEALWYSTNPNGSPFYVFWNNVLQDGFQLTGGMVNDPANIWVFYADANNGCDQCGGCGGNGIVVISANDLKGLIGLEIDKSCPNVVRTYEPCRYVGGLGHEIGHALGLQHPPECDENYPDCWEKDLMMYGYTSYPDAYFNESDRASLNNNPFIQYIDNDSLDDPHSCMELVDTCNYRMVTERTIYYGDSILLEGHYQKTSGIYYDTLKTVTDCDSFVITHLYVTTPPVMGENVSICEGEAPLLTAGGENIRWYTNCPIPMNDLQDSRDGQSYKTVALGNQIWMAENLNYYTSSGSWYYNYDSMSFSKSYGRLYNWETAQDICPSEWHLPDESEWQELIEYIGGNELAGGRLKERGFDHWDLPNTDATNASGFTALPTGKKDYEGGFYHLGYYSKFWSSSETNSEWARAIELRSNSAEVFTGTVSKETAFGIRCIKENDLIVGTGHSFAPGNTLPGKYTYYVTQTMLGDEGPCDTVVLTIGKIPEPTGIDTMICEGERIFSGGSYYNLTGIYHDTLQTILGCDSVVITEVTVNDLPIIDLGNDTTIFTNDTLVLIAGNGNLYHSWSDGSSGQILTLYDLPVGDYKYFVSVTDTNHCINSDTIVVHVITSPSNFISSITAAIHFLVYPIPAGEFLYVRSNLEMKGEFIFELIDIYGKIVYKKRIENHAARSQIMLNILELKTGIYILRIKNNNLVRMQKIFKV